MTLHIYDTLEQGSDEWLEARRGIVTASTVGRLLTVTAPGAIDYDCPECGAGQGQSCVSLRNAAPIKTLHDYRHKVARDGAADARPVIEVADNDTSAGLVATLVAERITQHVEDVPLTSAMWRGVDDEPFAREAYSKHYEPVTEVGFIVREDEGVRVGYSPDGLVDDIGLIEIKSRAPKAQLNTILADAVPAGNMAQLQCGLWVTGRAWIDYVSFAQGMPLYVKRVYPQPDWFDAIEAAVAAFEATAAQILTTYTERVAGLPVMERRPDLIDTLTF